MSRTRRLALRGAADYADALIVEDDYDGEFYYGSQPQPPLKSIDTQDRVIYVGTFSKSLFPSLRLGFILVPGGLRSEEHTSELQSLMRISYAVFCLKQKKQTTDVTDV